MNGLPANTILHFSGRPTSTMPSLTCAGQNNCPGFKKTYQSGYEITATAIYTNTFAATFTVSERLSWMDGY